MFIFTRRADFAAHSSEITVLQAVHLDTQSSIRHHSQIAHPDQAEGRHRQDKLKVQLLATDELALAQATNGLGPTKAFPMRLHNTGLAGGASIDGR